MQFVIQSASPLVPEAIRSPRRTLPRFRAAMRRGAQTQLQGARLAPGRHAAQLAVGRALLELRRRAALTHDRHILV
jgi:hypothetical protein